MDISLRLRKIAEKIEKDTIIADIGTDHAYIPIFLYKEKIIKKAIACDISKGSLQKAKNNVIKYNMQKNIQTRLGNGLEKITIQDNIDTIIIAGMGGMLMIDILKNGINIVENAETLVLQPQKDIDLVRKYLHKIGFFIYDDNILIDECKYYNIIVAKKGIEKNPYTEREYIFGKFEIEEKSAILKEYILAQMYKMDIVLNNLQETDATNRILELEKQYELYKEVLKCL